MPRRRSSRRLGRVAVTQRAQHLSLQLAKASAVALSTLHNLNALIMMIMISGTDIAYQFLLLFAVVVKVCQLQKDHAKNPG